MSNGKSREFCKEMGIKCEYCKNGRCTYVIDDMQVCYYGYLADDGEEPLDEEF